MGAWRILGDLRGETPKFKHLASSLLNSLQPPPTIATLICLRSS